MPRKIVPITPFTPLHVCGRCNNKSDFPIPLDQVWEIFENYLFFIAHAYKINIHAFVLMRNHFHLLLSCSELNLGEALKYLMRETTKTINDASGKINHLWGSRNHKTLISSNHQYNNVYKYVYQNPLRAGLVQCVTEYKYSTLPGLLGLDTLAIPMADDLSLFERPQPQLAIDWLNKRPEEKYIDDIRRGLRRSEFRLPRINGKLHPLETEFF